MTVAKSPKKVPPLRALPPAPPPPFAGSTRSARGSSPSARLASPRSAGAASPRKALTPRFANPRGGSPRPQSAREIDRIRGVLGTPVDVPWRNLVKVEPAVPCAATLTADKLLAEHKARAQLREQENEKKATTQARAHFETRLKREKQREKREAARKRASVAAEAKAKTTAEKAEEEERRKWAADDAELRVRMQRRLDAEEAERNSSEAAARRMKDRWQSSRQQAAEQRAAEQRAPTDPFAEWRGTTVEGDGGALDEDEEAEDEEVEDDRLSEEERALAAARSAKGRERDVAARRILAHSSRSLMDALGLAATATDSEIESTVRRLLRLLHPDYSINLSIKGTRAHARITAAFKRLNGLRDDENT